MLFITNNSIKHQSFVYPHSNDQTVQTIQFSLSHLYALSLNVKQFNLDYINLYDYIRCYHSGPGSTWERWQWRVTLHSQSSSITRGSPSDCSVTYPGHLRVPYPLQLVYYTGPENWKRYAVLLEFTTEAPIWWFYSIRMQIWQEISVRIDEDHTSNPHHGVWSSEIRFPDHRQHVNSFRYTYVDIDFSRWDIAAEVCELVH